MERIAEVEHRTPVARGGENEPDNLVFACRACNDAKDVRTEDEFRDMPNDAISLLGIHPAMLLSALDYERRGYGLFGDERYRRLAWRMRYPGE
ncbi:MAG: HNH endonuclease signature motif containing protein [Ktedonobacterales bacterium]